MSFKTDIKKIDLYINWKFPRKISILLKYTIHRMFPLLRKLSYTSVPEWSKGVDLSSTAVMLREFESRRWYYALVAQWQRA